MNNERKLKYSLIHIIIIIIIIIIIHYYKFYNQRSL